VVGLSRQQHQPFSSLLCSSVGALAVGGGVKGSTGATGMSGGSVAIAMVGGLLRIYEVMRVGVGRVDHWERG
jgi:hypothetical protein